MLEHIAQSDDVKKLSLAEMEQLCEELRGEIIRTCSQNGGHLASNLGAIELTVALHKVFHSPDDVMIWDVGHQSYSHKILTGRKEQFSTLRKVGGLSGFQNPKESEHDAFVTGHAGTALSSAMGLAKARQLAGNNHDKVIAVVGDGALGNGITLEALDSVQELGANFILIVNDNKMSISRSTGALAHSLNTLITSNSYNWTKRFCRKVMGRLPGRRRLFDFISRWEARFKNLFVSSLIFEEAGFRYIGPIDGHQLPLLIKHLERIRDLHEPRPILFHVITEKGHGCPFAQAEPERFHGTGPFNPLTGAKLSASQPGEATFSQVFGEAMENLAEKHEDVLALSAAMASGTGLSGFAERFPERFVDTGITEEHATVFAGGLAAGGYTPFLALYATFMQRAVDCAFHDICLAGRHVVLCIDRAGAVEDGPTHHGFFDLAFLAKLPGLAIMCPADGNMLRQMIPAAYEHAGPMMVRYPKAKATALSCGRVPDLTWGKSAELKEGSQVAIWALGREAQTALDAAALLEQRGISASVTDVRFLKPFDKEALLQDAARKRIVTVEDGVGTLSDVVNSILEKSAHRSVMHFHWPNDEELPHGKVDVLRQQFGMTPEDIAKGIEERLEQA